MADFKTHVGVAAVGSGLLSTMCLGAGITGPAEVVTFTAVGTIGGMLPDIDSDHSSPIKILFTALALTAASLAVFSRASEASILEIWAIAAVSYFIVRHLAWKLFAKLTVHRGVFHSVVAALFFWFLVTATSHKLLGIDELMAWTVGFFVFFGFMAHLILDEVYAVDMMRTELKRSFGTACKLFDYGNWKASLLMILAMVGAFQMAPSHEKFLEIVSSKDTYANIGERFCPDVVCDRFKDGGSSGGVLKSGF